MPSFSGECAWSTSGRAAGEPAPCQVSFDEETLTIVPAVGAPIAVDLGDIDVLRAGEWDLQLSLDTGTNLMLSRFAKAFQDLERQLREAYRNRLAKCLLVADLDEVARFNGTVELSSPARRCSGPAEIRLYESNVAVLPDMEPGFQWRLADVEAVEFDPARYTVAFVRQGDRLVISRLAKRTNELAERARACLALLGERSAHALHALFPFLSPGQFEQLSARLREGASVPIGALRAVHPSLEAELLDKAVAPTLKRYLAVLIDRTAGQSWHAGFKVVRRASDTSDSEQPTPDESVVQVGDGLDVLYWFFFPIAGRDGAVSRIAWEATSRGGQATYVFVRQAGDPVDESIASLDSGLAALDFRREPVYLDKRTLESELRYRHYAVALRKIPELARVRQAFAGRVVHDSLESWSARLDALLTS